MNALRIVFAGTPAFGLPCLEAIAASEHELIGVYTQPDRPAGRGQKLHPSAIKSWALEHQYSIYQPPNFKTSEAVDTLKALTPDLLVVIAYGLILPQQILDIPRFGCINVHASLLPRWRGASPIQHAILKGDSCSGTTIMKMDIGMDTGDIFTMVDCPITLQDTAGSLHDKLSTLSVAPLMQVINALKTGPIQLQKQAPEQATYAPKINKEDAHINWNQPAQSIDWKIRAFNPWPVAYTLATDAPLKIHQAEILSQSSAALPGTILSLDKNGMQVATQDAILLVKQFQFPGGKVMTVKDWLNGGKSQLAPDMVLS